MNQTNQEIQELRASSEVIKANIIRIWGSISIASQKTGLTRQTLYTAIDDGIVRDGIIGRMWKMGVDPAELIKEIKSG